MGAEQKIEAATGLALLRAPFPANQISKLPKPYKRDSPKGKCNECGGYHGLPAVHLDYVGHAALTDRLLDADPQWSWEPCGFNPDGTPALDKTGGLWIKLTVCGVTRFGYGAADGKSGGDAIKEMIGDALRNAAMRFGAALDLWHKGDLHADEEEAPRAPHEAPVAVHGDRTPAPKREAMSGPYTSKSKLWAAVRAFVHSINGMGDLGELIGFLETPDVKALLEQCERDAPGLLRDGLPETPEYVPLEIVISQRRRDLEQIDEMERVRNPITAG